MADDSRHGNRRIDRRTALKIAGTAGIAGLAGCAGGGGQSDGTTSEGTTTAGDGSKPELTMWLGYIKTNDWFGQSKFHENFWRGAALKTFEGFKQATVPAVPGGTKITYEIPAKMYDQIRQATSIEEATSRAAEEINSVLAKHGRR